MLRYAILAVLGAPLCFAISAAAQSERPSDPVRHSSFAQPAVAYADLSLPHPLDRRGLASLSQALLFSESQMAFAERHFDEFVNRYNRIAHEHLPEFFRASAAAATSLESRDADSNYAQNISRLHALRRQFTADLGQAEEEFFIALQPVLTEEQGRGLARVRQDRQRARCASIRRWALPAVNVEMRPLVEAMESFDLKPEITDQLAAILDAHEHLQTHLLCQYARAQDEIDAITTLFLQRAALADDPGDDDADRDIEQQVESIRSRILRAAQQVRDANNTCLQRMKAILPDRTADRLDRRFRAVAYPSLHRDPDDLYETYERLLDTEDLSNEQLQRVAGLRQSYLLRYASIFGRMSAEATRWHDRIPASALSEHERQAHTELMDRLNSERAKLSADHRVILIDLLGEDHAELLAGLSE